MILKIVDDKGLIYGSDSKRISCDYSGILRIGTFEIPITAGTEAIMPVLYNGCTGEYKATFTSEIGNVYDLGKVALRGGRVVPPHPIEVELMELRCKVKALEAEVEALHEKNRELSNIFDTNSLNFLIN